MNRAALMNPVTIAAYAAQRVLRNTTATAMTTTMAWIVPATTTAAGEASRPRRRSPTPTERARIRRRRTRRSSCATTRGASSSSFRDHRTGSTAALLATACGPRGSHLRRREWRRREARAIRRRAAGRSCGALGVLKTGCHRARRVLDDDACRIAGARPHELLELSHHRRVHDQVAERPDRGHVRGTEESVRLHVDGHLGAEAAALVRNSPDVEDGVDGLVGDLHRPLVLEQE